MATLHRYHTWARALVLSVALVLLVVMACSCSTMRWLGLTGSERVMADPQYVGGDTPSILTDEPVLDAAGQPTGRNYVIVDESELPERAPRVPLDDAPTHQPEGPWGEIASLFLGPAAGYAAGVAAKLLLTRRGRSSAAFALRGVARGNVLEAARGVAQADGWLHSRSAITMQPAASQTPSAASEQPA